jgi:hypothetical protein
MKVNGGVEVQIHVFLTLALAVGQWTASRSCHLTPLEGVPRYPLIGDWVGPRSGLNDMEK